MNKRFLQYIAQKGLSQARISELSCVSPSTVSRFCKGLPVASDKLLRMLQVCNDMSLEWFFYGSGEMIRSEQDVAINIGHFAGAEVMNNSPGVKVGQNIDAVNELSEVLLEKDRLIAELSRTISARDQTISHLFKRLDRKVG